MNVCKESQALVDAAPGKQEILKPPSGGFSLIAYCHHKLPTHSKQAKDGLKDVLIMINSIQATH
ncbi:hypothetical protein [Polynucleobacter sp. AP-RePozz3-80-G7]|jgi:hypothetical protein|uniref:hypothetical protein n=1 Tax=Polynucleobacter sp. AP-RePozz3-80-G7 TaxID=2689105 RepID=UPI001C0E0078|nr:hypothetical protein [Polynucleobacter sp. AP-RePozz3-80-G7]MBU3639831.1 hypothetical protein [Polynucleobacter sp. AP-RePozz3-80-G7]